MRFAAVHIPEFPALALARNSPLIVVDGVPPQEKVFSFCSVARRSGVQHGMSKVQAEAVCPGSFLTRDIAREQQAFERVCSVVDRFSPRIQAVRSPADDYAHTVPPSALLLLDASGMGALFGTDAEYARRLYDCLQKEGFASGFGVAVTSNAEASLMFARSAASVTATDDSGLAKRLQSLPVSLLPCEPKLLATLARWGIRTLGQLAALPEAALVSRLGQHGHRLQALARGTAETLLVPEEPAFVLSETTSLDSPVELLDSLLFVVSPLLEAVMRKAVERAYALRSVTLDLGLERAEPHRIRVQPAMPTQNRDALLKLLNLELQAKPPQASIVAVTLTAEAAQPNRAQRGLFQSQFPESDRLDLLLARLRAIVGENNVGSPTLLNSHREDAFVMQPFEPRQGSNTQTSVPRFGLALRVFRPPQMAKVTCWADRPKMIYWAGIRHLVSECVGPWHSSGSWWDGQAWEYDLWDVATAEPTQTLRLKHERSADAWSVMGVYD